LPPSSRSLSPCRPPPQARALAQRGRIDSDDYDWSLNEAK
jgi:hypothetical protein